MTIPEVVRRVSHRDSDVAVFSEYRHTRAGDLLRRELQRVGLGHQAFTPAICGNGVLIAAAMPFEPLPDPFGLGDDEYPNAVLLARFQGLHVYGAYLPGQDRKRPHMRCLIAAAKRHDEAGDRAICIGDLNSGRNETDIEINVRSGRLLDELAPPICTRSSNDAGPKRGPIFTRTNTSSVGIPSGANRTIAAAPGGGSTRHFSQNGCYRR